MEEINIIKKKERTLVDPFESLEGAQTQNPFFSPLPPTVRKTLLLCLAAAANLTSLLLLLNPLNPRFDLGLYLSSPALLVASLSEKDLSISVAESLTPWLLPSLNLLIVSFRFTFLDLFFFFFNLNWISIRVFVWFDFRQIYIIFRRFRVSLPSRRTNWWKSILSCGVGKVIDWLIDLHYSNGWFLTQRSIASLTRIVFFRICGYVAEAYFGFTTKRFRDSWAKEGVHQLCLWSYVYTYQLLFFCNKKCSFVILFCAGCCLPVWRSGCTRSSSFLWPIFDAIASQWCCGSFGLLCSKCLPAALLLW